LDEAIKAHAGEALVSAKLFTTLAKVDREKLLAFLSSLAAPREATLVAQQ
jgi:CxxC motif-containing protein (DUF1111 family)